MFKIEDLETACLSVVAAPQFISPSKRRDAEEYLIDFREKSTIAQCQEILQKCQSDHVKFQASCALKAAFPRECIDIQKTDLLQLISSLLFQVEADNCSNQVREQLVAIIAIAAKRNTGQNKDAEGIELVQQKIQELASGNHKASQILAASLISAVVSEFSGAGRSSNIGLSLEGHAAAKTFYENNALPGVFSLVLNFFKFLNSNQQMLQESSDQLLVSKFLEIGQMILSWRFDNGRSSRQALIKADATIDVPFMPPVSWRDLVTSDDFLNVWFSTHGVVRRIPELANISSTCIQQVCSLKGSMFSNLEKEVKWTIHVIELIQSSFPNWIPAQQYESAGLSFGLKYLIENRTIHVWQKCEAYINPLLNSLSQWTCSMIEHARNSEEYQTGLDYATDSWIHFLNNFGSDDGNMAKVLAPYANMVWQRWMRSKLGSPDGDRNDPDEDEEDIDELEESDDIQFDCQLAAIGLLSRVSISQSMPQLSNLTRTKINSIASCLQSQTNVPDSLWEDLHWLILATGHMIADETDSGETRYIPAGIMKLSIAQKAEIAEISVSTDSMLQVVWTILHAMKIEEAAMQANITHAWSPQTAQDLRWLLLRFTEAYVWFDEDHHPTMSNALHNALGRDTPSGTKILNDIIDFCLLSFTAWSGEESVLNQTCEILIKLLKTHGPKAKATSGNVQLWQMAKSFCADKNCIYSQFPQSTQRLFMSVIVYAGASGGIVTSSIMQESINPLKTRFSSLSAVALSTQMGRVELADILERLTGCVQAVTPDIAVGIAEFLLPFLSELGALVEAVHGSSDISILLFQLMAKCSKHLLPYLSDKQCQPFLKISLELLQGHTKWNQGRMSRNLEEEVSEELINVIKLISYVLDREVLDFSNSKDAADASLVSASDMVFAGLHVILPLMGPQLLAFPELANLYFSLLNSLCEIFPEKMANVPDTLMLPLLQSLQLGLTHYGTEMAKISIEAISALSSYVYDTQVRGGAVSETLANQLRLLMPLVFDSLLLFASDMDLLPVCVEAFFFMICSFPNQFGPLIKDKSASCNAQQQLRIEQTFSPVINHIFTANKSKNDSVKLLEAAVFEIRGLLCMK